MNSRAAISKVASFLTITLPAVAQPAKPRRRAHPQTKQPRLANQCSRAELIGKLEETGYPQVRDVKSTAEGIAAKATKDGKEISPVADSSDKSRER